MSFVDTVKQTLLPVITTPLPQTDANYYMLYRMATNVDTFNQWMELARKFLPTAVRIEIETESNYDDEGSYYDSISAVTGYDAEGNRVVVADELDDEFRECWWDFDTPDIGDRRLDFREPPACSWTRSKARHQVGLLLAWINQMPDHYFATEDNG